MQSLTDVLNAKSAILRVQDIYSQEVGTWISHNMDPNYQQLYRDYFVNVDPVIPTLKALPMGSMHQSRHVLSPDFKQSEFFQDYIKPQGIENLAGGFLNLTDTQVALFGMQRSDSMGLYTRQEMKLLNNLAPHLQRAIQVNQHLLNLEEKAHIASKALDRLPVGVVFVDAKAKAVYVNRKFEKLIAVNKSLCIKSGQLIADTSRNTNALNKLIQEAGNVENRRGGSLIIENADNSQSLNVLVTPISPRQRTILGAEGSRANVVLFISTTGQQHDLPLNILKDLYGLTQAEAQLAANLANGDSLETYAEKQGVSKNTVRNQLKACFQKTGVNRQAELVNLLLTGIPALSDDITNFSFGNDSE